MSRRPVAARLCYVIIACYPRRFRQRYADEMRDVLDQHHTGVRTALNLLAKVIGTHLDPAYRWEGLTMIRLRRPGPRAFYTVFFGVSVLARPQA